MTPSSSWLRDLATEGVEPNPGPGCTAPHCRCNIGEVDFIQNGGWATVNEMMKCTVCNHDPSEHENKRWQNLLPSPERKAQLKVLGPSLMCIPAAPLGIIVCQSQLGAHLDLLWIVLIVYFVLLFNVALRCWPPSAITEKKQPLIDETFIGQYSGCCALFWYTTLMAGMELKPTNSQLAAQAWRGQIFSVLHAIFLASLLNLTQLSWAVLAEYHAKPGPRTAILSLLTVSGVGASWYLLSAHPVWLWVTLTIYLILASMLLEMIIPLAEPVKPPWLLFLFDGLVLVLAATFAVELKRRLVPGTSLEIWHEEPWLAVALAVCVTAFTLWSQTACTRYRSYSHLLTIYTS